MSTKMIFVALIYTISLVFSQTEPPFSTTLGVTEETCCQCTQESGEEGCEADPVCEQLICSSVNGNCCRRRWGQQCADAAISQCGNIEACCGCLNAQNSPLCQFDAECTESVCGRDPFCCTNQWDDNCVRNADAVCFGTEAPICCGCSVSLPWPGCSIDAACEEYICQVDPYCCGLDVEGNRDWTARWDGQCQQQAQAVCNGESLITTTTTTTTPPRATTTDAGGPGTTRTRTTDAKGPGTTAKGPGTTAKGPGTTVGKGPGTSTTRTTPRGGADADFAQNLNFRDFESIRE